MVEYSKSLKTKTEQCIQIHMFTYWHIWNLWGSVPSKSPGMFFTARACSSMPPMGICVYVCASVYINSSLWVPSSIKTNTVWTIFQELHNSCYGLFTGSRGSNLTFNLFIKDLWSSLSLLCQSVIQGVEFSWGSSALFQNPCSVYISVKLFSSSFSFGLHILWSRMIQNPNLWMCEPPLRLSSFSFLSLYICPS